MTGSPCAPVIEGGTRVSKRLLRPVSVPVVNVRVVGVGVDPLLVGVGMGVRACRGRRAIVGVAVVLVVPVVVLMLDPLMAVVVFVVLQQVQGDPERHEQPAQSESARRGFFQDGE